MSVVVDWLQAEGYGQSSLCQRVARFKPDAEIDIAQAEVLLAEAASISAQPLAALDIGRLVERGHLGPIGHMLASTTTLEQMLNSYVFYEGLFYGKNIANVRRNEEGIELYWAFNDVPSNYARFAMSSFASAVEQMGLPRNVILAVSFPFKEVGGTEVYREKIGCREAFFGRELGIQFAKSALERSVHFVGSDTATQKLSTKLFPEIRDVEFAESLYNKLVQALPKRQARLQEIANELAISERTLQRKLESCDDGLRGIINRVRMNLACEYLQDNSMNLLAISLLLGYSEQSAFHLAFKKYHGVTPGQWRQRNATGEA